jgi:polyhydroxyalkanoate synthesis regulator phasin
MKKNGKKVIEGEELEEAEEERNRFFEVSRKVLLASIGAVALAQDEIEDFVNRLVERGEIAEKDARKLIREVADKRRKSAEHELDKRLEEVLDQLNVPSKTDIDALGHKITALTHKVEELKKVQA